MAEPHGPETYRQDTAEGLLLDWFAFLRQRNRHVWAGPERAHVQVRYPDAGSDVEGLFAEAVRSLFERQEDVNWARYNAETRRVDIDGPAAASDPQRLVRLLEELEEWLGLLDQELGVPGGPRGEHPADLEAIERVLGRGGIWRARQAEGRGVMVFARADLPVLAVADLAVGFRRDQGPPPWGAHMIAWPEPTAAWLLLSACRLARRCARQSVQASLIEVVVGLTLCLDGVDRRTSLGVNQATHLLAVIAIANGVRLARNGWARRGWICCVSSSRNWTARWFRCSPLVRPSPPCWPRR